MSESMATTIAIIIAVGIYVIIGLIIYIALKSLIRYGINYYFDILDYRAKEFAEIKERLRRAGLDAELRRINNQLDEMEKQGKD